MMEDKEREHIKNLAIFGGTFNPIHNGHIHLARRFAEILGAETVLLIPTSTPPHKQESNLADISDRLEMCRLAARGLPFEVSDIEMRRGGRSFTADTLRGLKKIYPNAVMYFLMGEDMFLTLEHWREPEVIFSYATICVAPRSKDGGERLSGYASGLRAKGAKVQIEPITYLPLSSTMVREAVRKGESISGMVPQPVAEYIRENHLYLE